MQSVEHFASSESLDYYKPMWDSPTNCTKNKGLMMVFTGQKSDCKRKRYTTLPWNFDNLVFQPPKATSSSTIHHFNQKIPSNSMLLSTSPYTILNCPIAISITKPHSDNDHGRILLPQWPFQIHLLVSIHWLDPSMHSQ